MVMEHRRSPVRTVGGVQLEPDADLQQLGQRLVGDPVLDQHHVAAETLDGLGAHLGMRAARQQGLVHIDLPALHVLDGVVRRRLVARFLGGLGGLVRFGRPWTPGPWPPEPQPRRPRATPPRNRPQEGIPNRSPHALLDNTYDISRIAFVLEAIVVYNSRVHTRYHCQLDEPIYPS